MTLSCFEKIEQQIIGKISSSQNCIFVAVAWFTNQLLFDGLMDAVKKNVAVKILILNDILNRNEFSLNFGTLTKMGAEVRFAKSDKGTMHNKFCIIDDMVITGSYNWTYHANKNNENILMTDEESVVNSYKEEFIRLFDDATPIPHPYEYLRWQDVKEGDFSEYRRNIYREVIAKDDENSELQRIKLINLDRAYKSGDSEALAKASAIPANLHFRTISDVLINIPKKYVGDCYNALWADFDGELGDVRFSTIDRWIFIPRGIGKSKHHKKYIRGYLHFYKWYKRRYEGRHEPPYSKMRVDVYDEAFISSIEHYWQEGGDVSKIPERLICVDLAKQTVFTIPSDVKEKNSGMNGIAVFSMVKEVNNSKIIYYDGWDPQLRREEIIKKLYQRKA